MGCVSVSCSLCSSPFGFSWAELKFPVVQSIEDVVSSALPTGV